MLLEARDVTKAFGSFKAVDAASVTLEQGDILGLIGPNGAGKSTFFNCLTGDLLSTSGKVLFEGQDITNLTPEARAQLGLARTFQVPQTFEGMSVLENVMIGAFLRTSHRAEAETRARAVLARVGMSKLAEAPARSLGTPGRKRLEIARALATEPKVLLLDEAMAGLTQREVQLAIDLVRDIHRSGITLVIVEHIMEVIMSLTTPGHGISPGPRNRARQPARGHGQSGGDRGLSGHAGRQGCRRPHPDRADGRTRDMTAPLLQIEHLEVRYGDLIGVSDVSLDVPEGSVVALLGSNGGGKTTVLNAIAGLIPVHSGSIGFRGQQIGGESAFSIVRKGLALSPEGWRLFVQQSVENNLMLGATPLRNKARSARLLERVYEIFPKLAERRNQRAGTMSGGERQMLAVGRALMSDPKLLMLDEPSLGLAPTVVEFDVRDVWAVAPGRADDPARRAIHRTGAGGLGFRDRAASRQERVVRRGRRSRRGSPGAARLSRQRLSKIAREAGTLAEMLRPHGYRNYMIGKWHVTPLTESGATGPFDGWPLGRGFDRFYGFLDAETDQYAPELVSDNTHIDPPGTYADGYHLTSDLVDQSIRFIADHTADRPDIALADLGRARRLPCAASGARRSHQGL